MNETEALLWELIWLRHLNSVHSDKYLQENNKLLGIQPLDRTSNIDDYRDKEHNENGKFSNRVGITEEKDDKAVYILPSPVSEIIHQHQIMTEIFIWSMWIRSINLNFIWLGRVYDDFRRQCSIKHAESFKIVIKLRTLASLASFDHSFCHIFELFSLSEKNIVNLAFLFHNFVPFRLGEHMSLLSELFYSISLDFISYMSHHMTHSKWITFIRQRILRLTLWWT